jgi:hypothetical protein
MLDYVIRHFPWQWAFPALLLIPLLLNGIASRFDFKGFIDAFGLSVMIVIIWAITNLMAALFDPPMSKALHWLIDFVGLSVCIMAWRTHHELWKLFLAALFLIQLGLHALFWVEWQTQPHGNMLYEYVFGLNMIWLVQLAVTAWPGGRYVVGRLLAWSFPRRGLDHGQGHARR